MPIPLPTPLKVNKLNNLLLGYQEDKRTFVVEGFTYGFRIPSTLTFDPPKFGYTNHRSALQHFDIVSQKLAKEASLGRIAGPFSTKPFPDAVISPLALAPKKSPGQFRLLHDLSYPKNCSVNSHIPREFCVVEYELLDTCIRIIQILGRDCLIAKADLQDAFRIMPIHPLDYRLLVFTWQGAYYYDKCLPMGCSVSCNNFESLSNALQWIMINKLGVKFMSHILDDFVFFSKHDSPSCSQYLKSFIALADVLNLPIKHSKTVLPSTCVELHGIQVDTSKMEMSLPHDKLQKASQAVESMYKRKSVQLRELQSLIGTLNFACKVVVPGRAFLRRLIDLTCGVVSPNRHVGLNVEARADLAAWRQFLIAFNGRTLCLPNEWTSANSLKLYTDASGRGYAAVFGSTWIQGKFPASWGDVNIAIKELLPIVLAVRLWSDQLSNKRLLLFVDNMSIVHCINKLSSKEPTIMKLLRQLVVTAMSNNIHIAAKHIIGRHNVIADLLSRFQTSKARILAPWLAASQEVIPPQWLPW